MFCSCHETDARLDATRHQTNQQLPSSFNAFQPNHCRSTTPHPPPSPACQRSASIETHISLIFSVEGYSSVSM
jgi:hypothetical protein